jgi:hypothetical protein
MRSARKYPQPFPPFDLDQHLSRYALAAAAAGVGILALAQPADGEIVYTPAHQQIAPNTTIELDLNGDGITDFQVKDFFSTYFFSSLGEIGALPAAQHNQIMGHVVSARPYASALLSNALVGSKGQFLPGSGEMAEISFLGGARHREGRHPPASASCTAPWANVMHRYLGLKFMINSEVHFGWARMNVSCAKQGSEIGGLLTGYAYETIPNQSILTGAESGTYDSSQENSGEATIEQASLGRLAQGASGVSFWRREQ